MKKTIYVIAAVIIAATVLTSVILFQLTNQPQSNQYKYNFDNGFEGWVADADLPQDPNNPGELVDWKVELVSNISYSGAKSALFYIDGLQDDGTIWIEKKLTLEPNTAKNVNVSFQFWSESESFNTIAVVVGYVGTKNPTVEDDFIVLGAANQAEGWKTYSVSNKVETDDSGEAYVAVGISVRWETPMTYFIDDITINID